MIKDKYKILISEDDDELRLTLGELIEEIFKHNGVNDVFIDYAKEPKELVRKGINEKYDLIISGEYFTAGNGRIDGILALKKIIERKKENTTTILLSEDEDSFREYALQVGVSYVVKKEDTKKLAEDITSFLDD